MQNWLILFAVLSAYSYLIYPIVLCLTPPMRRHHSGNQRQLSTVTISHIVAVYNGESQIRDKLENAFHVAIPGSEVVVVSDGSDDGTDQICTGYHSPSLKFIRTGKRVGKESAQLLGISKSDAEILVFSDVATRLDDNAMSQILRLFSDPEIGAISSCDVFINPDGTVAGEGAYVRYEMWLRSLESDRAGLVGLSGSFFAARREACENWDANTPSDLNVALNCSRLGLRAVHEPKLRGIYQELQNTQDEHRRKVRTAIRGMTGLSRNSDLLRIGEGMFAFQLWSHKVMRWLVPWFLLGVFIFSGALVLDGPVYATIFLTQVAVYLGALIVHFFQPLRRISILRFVHYLVVVHVALAIAGVRFLFGERVSIWSPSKR